MKYLLDRLKEPGTMRSLIWVLLSIAGQSVTDDSVASFALLGTMALGFISAAMPEKKAVVMDSVATTDAVQSVTNTAVAAEAAVTEVRGLLSTIASKLR